MNDQNNQYHGWIQLNKIGRPGCPTSNKNVSKIKLFFSTGQILIFYDSQGTFRSTNEYLYDITPINPPHLDKIMIIHDDDSFEYTQTHGKHDRTYNIGDYNELYFVNNDIGATININIGNAPWMKPNMCGICEIKYWW